MTLRHLYFISLLLTVFACHSLRPVSSSEFPSKASAKKEYTKKNATTKSSIIRKEIVRYATRHKGAKYKYGAKGPKRFDCSGFTLYVYKSQNIDLPAGSYNQARLGKKVSLKKAQPGDLVFFGKHGKVNHVALITQKTKDKLIVIHSTSSRGVVEEDLLQSGYWKPRILFVRNVL
ncbi:MAG TPA: NlpC/P60 family protein [Phaeodactylibacter sp.]|nr:NlpC/P60 family protein [Phaeodactylibacter sp.]